jgi:hypothetical protein
LAVVAVVIVINVDYVPKRRGLERERERVASVVVVVVVVGY